jgi:hypothetical protein
MQAALIDLLLAAEEPAPEPEELLSAASQRSKLSDGELASIYTDAEAAAAAGLVAAPRNSSPRGELAAAELLVAAYLPAAAAAAAAAAAGAI